MHVAETQLNVRQARPDEYAAVAEVTVEAYREYSGAMPLEMWRAYEVDLRGVEDRAREAVTLVAEQHGQLVGAVAYYPARERETRWVPDDWAFIRVLAVPPQYRGRGIGKQLTQACIARARAEGASHIGLMTTELMQVAKAMYERMGFQQLEEFESSFGGHYWSYGMALAAEPLPETTTARCEVAELTVGQQRDGGGSMTEDEP